ncbi:MAG: hypothetical protein Q9184_002544 [Pyrenodesmia sp. 2 TL-2023]
MSSTDEQVRRIESTTQDLRDLITRFRSIGQFGSGSLQERLGEALNKVVRDETALQSAHTRTEEARKQQEDAASKKERVRLRTDEQRQRAQSLDEREKEQLGQISKLIGAQQKATNDLTAALNSLNINAESNSKSLKGSSTTISQAATEFRSHLGELKSGISDLSSASTTSKNDLIRAVEEFKSNSDPLITSLQGNSTSLQNTSTNLQQSSRSLSTHLFNMGSIIKDVQPHLQQVKADTASLTAASTTAQDTNSQLASAVQGLTAVLQENQTLRDTLQKEQAKVTQQQQELDSARQMLGDHRDFQAFKETLEQERDTEVNRLKQEIAGLEVKIGGWEKGHADRLKEFDNKKQAWLNEADRRDRLAEDRVRQIESKQVELAKDLFQTHNYVMYAKSTAETLKRAPEMLVEQKYKNLFDELESVEDRLQMAGDQLRGYRDGIYQSAQGIDRVNDSALNELDAAKAMRDELRDDVRRFEEKFPEFLAALMLNSDVQYNPEYRGLRRDLENVERGLSPRSLAGVKEEMNRQRRLSPGGLAGVQGEIGRQSRPFSIGSGASDDEAMGLGIEDPDPTQSSVGKRGYEPSSVEASPQKEPRAKKARAEPRPEPTLSPILSTSSPEKQRHPKPRPQKSIRLQSPQRTTGPRVSLFESTSLSQVPRPVARPARQPIPSFSQPTPTTASHASSSGRQSAIHQESASAPRDRDRRSTIVSTSPRRRSIVQGEGRETVPELQEEEEEEEGAGEIVVGGNVARIHVHPTVENLWNQIALDDGIKSTDRVRLADWMAAAQKKGKPAARPGHIIRDCANNSRDGVQICLTSRLRGKSGVKFTDGEANHSCAVCKAQFPCLRASWVSNQAMNDEGLPIRWMVQQRVVPS